MKYGPGDRVIYTGKSRLSESFFGKCGTVIDGHTLFSPSGASLYTYYKVTWDDNSDDCGPNECNISLCVLDGDKDEEL